MKRSFLAAGIGLSIFAFTMVVSNHPVRAEQYNGNYIEQQQDTTPKKKKDTTKRRDTMNINLSPTSTSQK